MLPATVWARIAIEAASPIGWKEHVGDRGIVIGMETFGASAPVEVNKENLDFLFFVHIKEFVDSQIEFRILPSFLQYACMDSENVNVVPDVKCVERFIMSMPRRQLASVAREGQPEGRHLPVVANQQDIADQYRMVPGFALDRRELRELLEFVRGRRDKRQPTLL